MLKKLRIRLFVPVAVCLLGTYPGRYAGSHPGAEKVNKLGNAAPEEVHI